MFETTREAGVLALERAGTAWLSTGVRGGRVAADAAYCATVPEGWRPADLDADVTDRLAAAGHEWTDEPVLLTGVDVAHARGASLGPVTAVVTAGLSNPAELPLSPAGGDLPDGEWVPGTVNVVVGTEESLTEAGLANLVAVAAEAKAATLLGHAGVPGTTSDAVVAGMDPAGERRQFTGSATRIGAAARACVRDALLAALDARYGDEDPPGSTETARYGVVTEAEADVFRPGGPS